MKKIFIAIGILIVAAGAVIFFKFNQLQKHVPAIARDAEKIFVEDTSMREYIKEYGVKAAIARLSELGTRYGDCHQRAHQTGRMVYTMMGDKAFMECSAECHSGCYHGATEAFFADHGTANLSDNLKTLCSSVTNAFFSHQCIHGIGHGLMAWADYDIFKALKGCDLLNQRQDSCWTGVFMENIVGGLTEKEGSTTAGGHYTKYLSDNPQYPCSIVDEKYKSSCYFLQTSRMIVLFGGDYAKVAGACLKAPAQYQYSCFGSMGRDVGGTFRRNPKGAIAACANAPEGQNRDACLSGAIQDSFWDPTGQDDAITFCKTLSDQHNKSLCYGIIFQRAPDVLASKNDIKSFCFKAEKEYQDQCLAIIK